MPLVNRRLMLLAVLLSIVATNEAFGDSPTVATYRVEFSAENPGKANIEADIVVSEQKLRMASWGHPYLPRGWATFVNNLSITNQDGDPRG